MTVTLEEYKADLVAGKVKRAKWSLEDEPCCLWCGEGYPDGLHPECRVAFWNTKEVTYDT